MPLPRSPSESPDDCPKIEALIQRLFALPAEYFEETDSRTRTAVVSKDGHILSILVTDNGGFLFNIVRPLPTQKGGFTGGLVVNSDFTFSQFLFAPCTINADSEITGDSEILTVVQEVCDAGEKFAQKRIPALILKVRRLITATLGKNVERRLPGRNPDLPLLNLMALRLYRNLFKQLQNHEAVMQALFQMHHEATHFSEVVRLQLPPGMEFAEWFLLLNYICINSQKN